MECYKISNKRKINNVNISLLSNKGDKINHNSFDKNTIDHNNTKNPM